MTAYKADGFDLVVVVTGELAASDAVILHQSTWCRLKYTENTKHKDCQIWVDM